LSYVGRALALRRAFSNLIENGAIYGEAAAVTLVATAAQVKVEICDRGPGIPPEHHKNVFAPFFRLEPSRSRETGGTGLGMTVAQSVIRRHGGDIKLSNLAGQGLRVTITFPCTG
ncbi:MAG: ATP-binding protein, partial [Cyanobacteria bacterium P01_G01_bin.38]